MIIARIKKWWNDRRYYVVIDPADNSVTLSRQLFNHIRDNAQDSTNTSVFMFHIPQHGTYAFMQNHEIDKPTQLCQIQYNDKHKTVGFESLCPSVGKIVYDYALNDDKPSKLAISIQKTGVGQIYYQLEKPWKAS